jgi:hypothetical protein
MTIVNDDSRVINKLEASLADDIRVIIYNRHMFIVQATDIRNDKLHRSKTCKFNYRELDLSNNEPHLI